MRATFLAHLVLLGLITLTILGEMSALNVTKFTCIHNALKTTVYVANLSLCSAKIEGHYAILIVLISISNSFGHNFSISAGFCHGDR
jgi:hypothetical protein